MLLGRYNLVLIFSCSAMAALTSFDQAVMDLLKGKAQFPLGQKLGSKYAMFALPFNKVASEPIESGKAITPQPQLPMQNKWFSNANVPVISPFQSLPKSAFSQPSNPNFNSNNIGNWQQAYNRPQSLVINPTPSFRNNPLPASSFPSFNVAPATVGQSSSFPSRAGSQFGQSAFMPIEPRSPYFGEDAPSPRSPMTAPGSSQFENQNLPTFISFGNSQQYQPQQMVAPYLGQMQQSQVRTPTQWNPYNGQNMQTSQSSTGNLPIAPFGDQIPFNPVSDFNMAAEAAMNVHTNVDDLVRKIHAQRNNQAQEVANKNVQQELNQGVAQQQTQQSSSNGDTNDHVKPITDEVKIYMDFPKASDQRESNPSGNKSETQQNEDKEDRRRGFPGFSI